VGGGKAVVLCSRTHPLEQNEAHFEVAVEKEMVLPADCFTNLS